MSKADVQLGYHPTHAGTLRDARRSVASTTRRARAAAHRVLDAIVSAQVRVAGGPWDGPRSGSPALAGRLVR